VRHTSRPVAGAKPVRGDPHLVASIAEPLNHPSLAWWP
jgi:hypothetical protein